MQLSLDSVYRQQAQLHACRAWNDLLCMESVLGKHIFPYRVGRIREEPVPELQSENGALDEHVLNVGGC